MKAKQAPFDHSQVYRLSPLVRRVTAPNPGMMTGPGTNSYLVGRERIAVIDTGVDDPAHIQRLAQAGNGRIRWILVTHTHPDHSRGALELKALTGAPVYAHPTPLRGIRDDGFRADAYVDEGDVIEAEDFRLRVLHTPGHAANHLCFLLEPEGLLFAGDQVMEGVTVVINPPDGDMNAYLDSLERLQGEPIRCIAPGHGAVIEQPRAELERIVRHRLHREQQILDLLATKGTSSIDELVKQIYADIAQSLHAMAARSVLAHLLKLRTESRVANSDNGSWFIVSR